MPEKVNYNPDILSCLANLSSDEVLTPPEIANAMLDMLPQELFRSPDTKFLDPGCKSGVFLREIAKRLNEGLKDQIPDVEKRMDHIMKNQLFAIAITQITGLLSRRSIYCSKDASSRFSVARFDNSDGNIRYRRIEHTWNGIGKKEEQKCLLCGAPRKQFDRGEEMETHAYEFIHMGKSFEKELKDMKFDVIIGNPPYQLSDGGSKASATPIYQLFVNQAKKLNPRYLTMIIPSRWFSGGKGLDDFRDEMLHDKRIRSIVDFFDPNECFPGIDLSGGVCYFLWNRERTGTCEITSHVNGKKSTMERPLLETGSSTLIRFNEAIPIMRRIQAKAEPSFSSLISSRKPFGLSTSCPIHKTKNPGDILIYAYPNNGYISRSLVTQNKDSLGKYKILISYAYGERGSFPYFVIGKPFLAEKDSCCSETYLIVDSSNDKTRLENIMTYMKTKLFRFLVLLRKNTQHATKTVYEFVPMQDFSKPWTDEELYKKYSLTEDEIAFIESMIKPMDGGDDA